MCGIEYPTCPADLPHDATLGELAEHLHRLIGPLVDARHGLGEPLPADQLAAHAIAALAVQHALAERALYSRWVIMCDALTHGATLEHTAAAMGLEVDEVAVGLRMWADGQHQHAGMSAAARDEVYAMAVRAVRGEHR